MRISGTEPSSVILSQRMKFKMLKSYDPKIPKQILKYFPSCLFKLFKMLLH